MMIVMKNTLLFPALLFFLAGCAQNTPVLSIEGGKVQGVETTIEGVYVYKGIPYAAAPIGDLRWKEPQAVTPWKGILVADQFGAASVQGAHDSSNPYTNEFFFNGDPEYSEDCLYLNVWTPAPGEEDAKLPVAMWIHGGGYTGGWGFEPEMDGAEWGAKGVVLVTINYRLGIFGFLVHPLLTAESEHGVSGNYGILDQIAALKWIHRNIAQFGGDPDNITIFGQSAGAGSVKTLVSSPLTGDLVTKAIIQSGGGVSETPVMQASGLDALEKASKLVFDWGGYDTLEKMRAASTEEIYTLTNRYSKETGTPVRINTSPVVEGYVSKESFDAAAKAGRIKDIPYMIGFTLDDIGMLNAGIDTFCDLREKAGTPAFAYQFARPLPDDEPATHAMKGAFHSSELWYTFKSLQYSNRPFTEADYDLGEKMLTCWTNFAKTGHPGEGWLPWTSSNPDYMIFKLDEQGEEASGMGQPTVKPQVNFFEMMRFGDGARKL